MKRSRLNDLASTVSTSHTSAFGAAVSGLGKTLWHVAS
jgi:hypothetical protein